MKTLRCEVFSTTGKEGPWISLQILKKAVMEYVNMNNLSGSLLNISESIYAWSREDLAGVSRAFVTAWFIHPEGQPNPERKDSWRAEEPAGPAA